MGKQIYFGGDIITVNDKIPCVQAVLTENGVIKNIGNYKQLCMIAQDAKHINLNGKTMMPAFIDSHSHFTSYAISLLQPSVQNCRSNQDILQFIKDYIDKNSVEKDKWITIKDFDQSLIKDDVIISRFDLDKVSPYNPILLEHKSGHLGIFNSFAINMLGINTNDDSESINGVFKEDKFLKYIKKIPMPSGEEIEKAYLKAQDIYASNGIATVQEGVILQEMVDMIKLLGDKKLLKLELIGYIDAQNKSEIVSALSDYIKKYKSNIKLIGYKAFLDGSPQAKTAWLKKAYTDGSFGYKTLQDETLLKYILDSANDDMQMIAHCNGDASAEQYITECEKANNMLKGKKITRPVMIHAQILEKSQLERIKKLDMILSFFISHVYYWGDEHIKNLGFERASQISCARWALENDIKFTFHQDSPVLQPNMLETIWCAVNRCTRNGTMLGENQKISVIDAIKAVTINSAYQCFEQDIKGSIEVDKNADFVILSDNPCKIAKEKIKDISVEKLIKKGEVIYKI